MHKGVPMRVSVYSTTTCPYCVMLKTWLKSENIAFEDILIDRNPTAAKKMIKLSGQMGVPFTTVENDAGELHGVLGYDRATLSHLIGLAA